MFGRWLQELLSTRVGALLVSAGKKLPEIASGMGKAVREYKRATAEPEPLDGPPAQHTQQPVTDKAKKDGART